MIMCILRCVQVSYLEVVDIMVGQLLRRLADAEAGDIISSPVAEPQQLADAGRQPAAADAAAGTDVGGAASGDASAPGAAAAPHPSEFAAAATARFAVCVTGDHSTPVVFGDHSHEAVPFAVAIIADAVRPPSSLF